MPDEPQTRRTLRVREYGSVATELTTDQAVALALVKPDVLDVRPTGKPGEYRLRTGGFVGTLMAADVTVVIEPKVSLTTLLYLVSGSIADVQWFEDQHSRTATDDLATILYAMYTRLLQRSVRAGLVRDYQHRHDRVMRVQGRIDFAELAATPHRPFPAPCDFDEFTSDTLLNRYLKAAARDAVTAANLPGPVRRLLRAQLAAMAEVEDVVPAPHDLDGHVFTRLDRHYEAPAKMARLILSRRSVSERRGIVQGDSFLIDMSTVFEDHVAEGLRRRMPSGIEVEREPHTPFDRNGHLRMKPDIVFTHDRRTVHVADVKYKLLKNARARAGDLYQALAYTTVLDVPRASLVYADREGGRPPKLLRVVNSPTTIETHELSLQGQPANIERALDSLAEELHPHLTREPASAMRRRVDVMLRRRTHAAARRLA